MANPNPNIQLDVTLLNGLGGKVTITVAPPPPMSAPLEFDSSSKHDIYLPANQYGFYFHILYPNPTNGGATIIITDISKTPNVVLFNKTYSVGTDDADQFTPLITVS